MPTVNCNSVTKISWKNIEAERIELAKEIHIWRIPANAASSTPASAIHAWLNQEEFEKASRFYQQKDKQRFITSRIALKTLLGHQLSIDPFEVRIALGTNKKPYVVYEKRIVLEFNVAHAGEWVLIAIAGTIVGIDVEKIDEEFAFHDIMDYSFQQEEIQFVRNSILPRKEFYTLWTRKEAMLKATAKGLDNDLRSVPALDGLHTVAPSISGDGSVWTITSFSVDENHPGSIAYPSSAFQLQFFHKDSF